MRPWLLRLGLAASLLALLLSLFVAWQVVRREWDPLGPYPEQSVAATAGRVAWSGESYSDSTIQIPAIRLGDPAVVTGTKCSDETVTVSGTKAWTSRDPAGYTVDEATSVVPRVQGCRTATYENPPPAELVTWARHELESRPFVVVVLGGCETPVDDAHNGKTECWRSEPFAIIGG